MDEEGKDMGVTARKPKPIPKSQIGLNIKQKHILKKYVGEAPNFPVDLNTVREWERHGKD